jgi:hypothetical protein
MNIPKTFIIVLFFVDLLQGPLLADIWFVDQSQTNNPATGASWTSAFPTIQAGLNAAGSGDQVWVKKGLYREEIFCTKDVSFFGGFAGHENSLSQRDWMTHKTQWTLPIPMMHPFPGPVGPIFTLKIRAEARPRIDGFHFVDGKSPLAGAIHLVQGSPIIVNNVFARNEFSSPFGAAAIFHDPSQFVENLSASSHFTNLAAHIFPVARHAESPFRIEIFPTNHYTVETHRLLQIAANMVDGLANQPRPKIFQPLYSVEGGKVFITNYQEILDPNVLLKKPVPLQELINSNDLDSDTLLEGQPLLIGAQKNLPNLNEITVISAATLYRELEFLKQNNARPHQTNQYFYIGVSNLFGVELWNGYTNALTNITVQWSGRLDLTLLDDATVLTATNFNLEGSMAISHWAAAPLITRRSTNFILPILTNFTLLPQSSYSLERHQLESGTNRLATGNLALPTPKLKVLVNNPLTLVIFEIVNGQTNVLDYVSLPRKGTTLDFDLQRILGSRLATDPYARFFNPQSGSNLSNAPTVGILDQIAVSTGDLPVSSADWRSANVNVNDKERSQDYFRELLFGRTNAPNSSFFAPLVPGITVVGTDSFSVVDPLINDLWQHNFPAFSGSHSIFPIGLSKHVNVFNSLKLNLGNLNFYETPVAWWDDFATLPKLIRIRPDDFSFPENRDLNLEWLSRIHRGTPWETIYLGHQPIFPFSFWTAYGLSEALYSTNDLFLVEAFKQNLLGLSTNAGTSGKPVMAHNTFVHNKGPQHGAILRSETDYSVPFVNNLFGDNPLEATLGSLEFQNNILWNTPSATQLSGTALLLDPKIYRIDDFRVRFGSKAIDAGSTQPATLGWVTRPVYGTAPDIGAHEASARDPLLLKALSTSVIEVEGWPGIGFELQSAPNLFDWIAGPSFTMITNKLEVPVQAEHETQFWRTRNH